MIGWLLGPLRRRWQDRDEREEQAIVRVLAAHPDEMYTLDICAAAEFKSGTIYPALARLEQRGWVESHWAWAPHVDGSPRRRLYRLTQVGARQAAGADR